MANTKVGGRAGYNMGAVIENITEAKTLTPGDSGKVFTIDGGAGASAAYTITLPKAADAVGFTAKFIFASASTYAVTIAPHADEDTLVGNVQSSDGGVGGATAESGVDELIFSLSAELGDWAEVICDGTYFYVSGGVHDTNHITLA